MVVEGKGRRNIRWSNEKGSPDLMVADLHQRRLLREVAVHNQIRNPMIDTGGGRRLVDRYTHLSFTGERDSSQSTFGKETDDGGEFITAGGRPWKINHRRTSSIEEDGGY